MTVRELIELLQDIEEEETRVVFSSDNGGGYVDDVTFDVDLKHIRKFYGADEKAVVLYGEQVGMV